MAPGPKCQISLDPKHRLRHAHNAAGRQLEIVIARMPGPLCITEAGRGIDAADGA